MIDIINVVAAEVVVAGISLVDSDVLPAASSKGVVVVVVTGVVVVAGSLVDAVVVSTILSSFVVVVVTAVSVVDDEVVSTVLVVGIAGLAEVVESPTTCPLDTVVAEVCQVSPSEEVVTRLEVKGLESAVVVGIVARFVVVTVTSGLVGSRLQFEQSVVGSRLNGVQSSEDVSKVT